jgi:hypothetical protein
MKKLILLLALAGCDNVEKQVLLVDPTDNCQYIATLYGSGGMMSGTYIKPRTTKDGKQICVK